MTDDVTIANEATVSSPIVVFLIKILLSNSIASQKVKERITRRRCSKVTDSNEVVLFLNASGSFFRAQRLWIGFGDLRLPVDSKLDAQAHV